MPPQPSPRSAFERLGPGPRVVPRWLLVHLIAARFLRECSDIWAVALLFGFAPLLLPAPLRDLLLDIEPLALVHVTGLALASIAVCRGVPASVREGRQDAALLSVGTVKFTIDRGRGQAKHESPGKLAAHLKKHPENAAWVRFKILGSTGFAGSYPVVREMALDRLEKVVDVDEQGHLRARPQAIAAPLGALAVVALWVASLALFARHLLPA